MDTIPTNLQSSVDSSEISTTITSIGKILAGGITFIAMLKGVDPAIAGQQWGQFVQLVATGAPALYVSWYTAEMAFGLIRKAFVRLFVTKSVTPTV